jgi:hypothetical protein
MGGNCVRVFISFGSFYEEPGVLKEEGVRQFDEFLKLAEEAGVYVHPTGPDHWEGRPKWVGDRFADQKVLEAQEAFWKLFAGRYKGRKVIFAYDLLNEPMVEWKGEAMKARWNRWVKEKYGSAPKAGEAWGVVMEAGEVEIPEVAKAGERMILDYQLCREDVADEWTRRQAAAIKAADPEALVTVGLIQWAVPVVLPRVEHYAGFRPARQAKWLDFMEVHFYPLESGAYDYADVEQGRRNLAYVEAVVREVAQTGKPVVVAEFGWHGGGTFPLGGQQQSKFGSEEDQAGWCSSLIETTEGLACGWLNWGFYDHPQAGDVSRHTGLLTPEGKEKAWGRKFAELAKKYDGKAIGARKVERPELPWEKCITSVKACNEFRAAYYQAFQKEKMVGKE